MLQEEFVDCLSGRPQVLALHRWPEVIDDAKIALSVHRSRHRLACCLVPGKDHRNLQPDPQARPRVRGDEKFGKLHQMRHGAAVRAAGEEDHIRAEVADALDPLILPAAIINGDHVHDNGASAQCGALRALARHRANHSRDHHLQAATSARRGEVEVRARCAIAGRNDEAARLQETFPREVFHLGGRVAHANSDVVEGRLHRRRCLAPRHQPVLIAMLLNEDRLGGRAAAVGCQDRLYRLFVR